MRCDVCDAEIGHRGGCSLDAGGGEALVCSVCGQRIFPGDEYMYDVRFGLETLCGDCIERLEVDDILEICGASTVAELIEMTTDKICREGDIY